MKLLLRNKYARREDELLVAMYCELAIHRVLCEVVCCVTAPAPRKGAGGKDVHPMRRNLGRNNLGIFMSEAWNSLNQR
jgi:hypothetical protein